MKYSFSILTIGMGVVLTSAITRADDHATLPKVQFEKLHQLIKPQPGESRWMEIDWHPTVWEGRQRAAAEGKPLFIWAGSGGAPAAGC